MKRASSRSLLDEAESVALLVAALPRADPRDTRIADHLDDAAQLTGNCGYLPLALKIAAAVLVPRAGLAVAELAAQLADRRTRLDRLNDGERGVRAAFEFFYQQLAPGHARLFRLCGASPGPDLATEELHEGRVTSGLDSRRPYP